MGVDQDHGARAAFVAQQMQKEGLLEWLDPEDDYWRLIEALTVHSSGYTTKDLVIGSCWDADRLAWVRLGVQIDPALLCCIDWRSLAPCRARNAALCRADNRGAGTETQLGASLGIAHSTSADRTRRSGAEVVACRSGTLIRRRPVWTPGSGCCRRRRPTLPSGSGGTHRDPGGGTVGRKPRPAPGWVTRWAGWMTPAAGV